MDARFAHEAAGHDANDRTLLAALRAAQLVRTSGSAPQIEVYHDRIRETLTSLLEPPAVRRIHQRLAETFEATGFDDPEALFEHTLGAGDLGRAAGYAALAARKASGALAFDRAALLYRKALELRPPAGADRLELETGLAEALANAGDCAEAARHYLEAAREAGPARTLELQRRAAEQLLISGHIDEGLQVIRTVLAAFGMKLPRSPRHALLSMLLRRMRLRVRGLDFAERDARDIPEQELLRIDICWAVSVGLALVDIIRAADFQTRHLLLALQAGEPGRIAQAFAVEAAFSASPGRRGLRRARLFSAKADALARKVGKPHPIGLSILMAGITAYCSGQWRRGAALCEEAEVILREQCTGTAWEVTSAHSFLLRSLSFLGEIKEVTRRMPVLIAAALDRGNLYATTELRTRTNLVWLAADDPEGARREITEAMRRWSHGGFHRQHFNSLLAQAEIFLYRGEGMAAWEGVTGEWPALAGSLLLRVQILRVEATHLRARCALAVATVTADPEPWLRIAERLARDIERERMSWSDPLALLLRAAVAHGRHDEGAAAALLRDAAEGFTRAEMALYAAATRRRLGGSFVAEVDEWMHGQGIRRPELMTRALAPGFRADA
jgi:tetratricopeptide (TPR) repeat protein